jgi:asparagine synthase (glutamine-hydrolysing)
VYRYLALIWDPRSLESSRTIIGLRPSLAHDARDLPTVYEAPGVLILGRSQSGGAASAITLHGRGVVLGTIFSKRREAEPSRRQAVIDPMEAERIVATSGLHLIEQYWGTYIAFVSDSSAATHHVIREPTGNMECYFTTLCGVHVFFSHVEDCIRLLPVSFSPDRYFLARWFVAPAQMGLRTGLRDVEEVRGGERLSIRHDSVLRHFLWNPVEIAAQPRSGSVEEFASQVRDVVQGAVDAWASCYDNIVLQLSGGLDSSIVAACLAHSSARPRVTCVNFASDIGFDEEPLHFPGMDPAISDKLRSLTGAEDERYFARLVAERWKFPLIEKTRAVPTSLTRLWETSLKTSPFSYALMISIEDAQLELTRMLGAQAFFAGEGGDSVFLDVAAPLGAIDYAWLHGLRPGIWQHWFAAANANKESIWSIFRKIIRFGILKHRSVYVPPVGRTPTLLTDELIGELTSDPGRNYISELLEHASLPPGKANHVSGLGAVYLNVHRAGDCADHVHPLNSQPVWESLLSIPTYAVIADGTSRGLARKAFADVLPRIIRNRQIKGSGTPFAQNLIRRNIGAVRELLSDGLLVEERYLDRDKVVRCLAVDDPFSKIAAGYLLSYVAAEIWLRKLKEQEQPHVRRATL